MSLKRHKSSLLLLNDRLLCVLNQICWFCLGAYSALLFYIFFLARRRPHPSLFSNKRYINIVPFKDKLWYLVHQRELPDKIVVEFYKDLLGNVGLFIPLPFFMLLLSSSARSLRVILLTAFLISVSVESVQFILGIGVSDIDDLILNTFGAFLGYTLFMATRRLFPHLVEQIRTV